ncbi:MULTISPECIES: cysteine desulfurase family protein [Curtobacterium]|uniref:cysteine desulfurase n=1 Tax=Curtobacterium poinsettiae TaxID=159612 RepID=A0ABT3S423_9MICO|nr:cysteine desulfurase family protein [Curtobacterium flaccumfaciens]EYT64976.1 cysteine desulfurase [Curtobacterium flaccumfaciens UCD-AKU]MBT1609562.1 cysteine desulfurase [Curtobacterium flaccumfaciens pv. poinsettiae]MCS6566169.1 cysteine desulfurase [Curtobacterium flaccumfaciens pv. flaccumfaciens]MCX2849549.1 cysteine desulfurase family protein [Curtobacterium flaccumfaciens pv. poinsettiae]UXN18109.1 cysteine desulfurase [Curtobacterium flaccumfaciens pv. poinsettiae]
MFYLDRAATTPVRREVLEAMWPYLAGVFGNPSSTHGVGDEAARGLTAARAAVAGVLGCRPAEVVFTTGGTEGANTAIKGIALAAPRGRHVVTSAIEHEAVLESCAYLARFHDFDVTVLPVGPDGRVDPAVLRAALRPDTTLVSIAHADNEIGTVQDVPVLAAVAHEVGARFHTDAVQSAPWLPIGLGTLGVDALSLSGHKLGAPKGTGVLAVGSGVPLEPLLHGGGQERGRRSGTEDVAGAVAVATALGLAAETVRSGAGTATTVRDAVLDGVLAAVPGAFVSGSREHRLPGHASFCFPGVNGETVLLELEQRDVVSSSGSACAAGSTEASHVLTALGIPEDVARTGLRLTFDATLTAGDVPFVVGAVADAVATVRALG